jgi:hypothetical protein
VPPSARHAAPRAALQVFEELHGGLENASFLWGAEELEAAAVAICSAAFTVAAFTVETVARSLSTEGSWLARSWSPGDVTCRYGGGRRVPWAGEPSGGGRGAVVTAT